MLIGIIVFLPNIAFAKDIEIEKLVSSNEKYYKTIYNDVAPVSYKKQNATTVEISKEEYENSSTYEPLVYTTTEYKKLTTNIYSSGNAYKYEVILNWKKMPKIRSYDIIGIGFYESVTVDGTLNFSQKYCTNSASCSTSNTFTGKVSQLGASAVFKLPSGSFTSMSQTLSFKIKKSGNYTIIEQKAAGDYSHAQSNITEALAKEHSINPDQGIVLSSNASKKYDSINAAVATWNGTW